MPLPAVPNAVAIDTESTGLFPWMGDSMFAASVAFPDGRVLHWRDSFTGLADILEDATYDKVFHNAKHDLMFMKAAGLPKPKGRVWDTMILGHLLNGRSRLSLDEMAKRYLSPKYRKVVDELEQWFKANKIPKNKRGKSFEMLPYDLLKKRCNGDAVLTMLLFRKLYPTVASTFPVLLKQEHELIEIVQGMAEHGMAVDMDEVARQDAYFEKVVEDVTTFCADLCGWRTFNFNSHVDQTELLKKIGVTIKERTPSGRPSLRANTLRHMHHPVLNMLLTGKVASKLQSTFLGQITRYQVGGIVHPGFNQVGTVTGRFSCSNPNLMNIPKEGGSLSSEEATEMYEDTGYDFAPHIKRIFVCKPRTAMLFSDKSRIELRMLGHYSGDNETISIIGATNVHEVVCMKMFGEVADGIKTRAKRVVFGTQYGIGDSSLAKLLNVSIDEAKEYKRKLFEMMPGLKELQANLARQVRERGYVVTDHGRRHYLSIEESYMAINRMCQGTAGDEVKACMIRVHNELCKGTGCHVLLNVHDDIGIEVPLEIAKDTAIKFNEIMQDSCYPYKMPMPSETSGTLTNWGESRHIDFERSRKEGALCLVE